MGRHANILCTAIRSSARWVVLSWKRNIYLHRDKIGKTIAMHRQNYVVFRETAVRTPTGGTPVVLVVGFRLLGIRSNTILHWVFQRICILTTPGWSGMPGFQTKLWLVNPKSKDYLGIYTWRGEDQSQAYITYLLPVLRICSVKGTVWYERVVGQELDQFLTA